MAQQHQSDSREPPETADAGVEPSRSTLINRTLALDIIPRLVRNHAQSPWRMPGRPGHPGAVQPEEVAAFAQLVLQADDRALNDSVVALRERGVPVEAIFLDLLAPVARLLGHRWVTDECTCTDVAIGLGRLQQVVRDHSASLVQQRQALTREGRRILLTSAPGEVHTLGLSIVSEFFMRAGWDVDAHFMPTEPVSWQVQSTWYDVVGFTVGSLEGLEPLARAIESVRRQSLNRCVSIIAGGPVFTAHPDAWERITADEIITDGASAPRMAERLVCGQPHA